MKTETTAYHPDEFTLKEKLTYAILGLVVVGGSFFIGRAVVRRARAVAEEKKTYEEGTPATYAKQIKMALDNDNWFGWGTDERALRRIFLAVPSKAEFSKVIASYQKLYARAMMADIKSDLTTSEYNEMLAIISAKPERGSSPVKVQSTPAQFQSWAKRLRAAFEDSNWVFPGTDERAIKEIFMEMPSQTDFWNTATAYKNIYGDDLIADLKDELTFIEYPALMSILVQKPKM